MALKPPAFALWLVPSSCIDEKMESVIDKMNTAEGCLVRIEENTGKSAVHLGAIKDDIKKIVRDGLKMK